MHIAMNVPGMPFNGDTIPSGKSLGGSESAGYYMAKALVDSPDDVEVREIEGEQSSVIELRVAREDLGKVIGKQGRTARAMRTILSAASTKLKKRAVLDIIE